MTDEFSISPEVPEDHPLRALADVLDQYADREPADNEEPTFSLFTALGSDRLFDLGMIALRLLSAEEQMRFMRIYIFIYQPSRNPRN